LEHSLWYAELNSFIARVVAESVLFETTARCFVRTAN